MSDRNTLIALAAFLLLMCGLYANRKYDEHVLLVRFGLEDLREGTCKGEDCALFYAGRKLVRVKEWENGRSCPAEPDPLRQGCLSEIADRLSDMQVFAEDLE